MDIHGKFQISWRSSVGCGWKAPCRCPRFRGGATALGRSEVRRGEGYGFGIWFAPWRRQSFDLDGSGANYPIRFVCLLLAIMERVFRLYSIFFGPELTCTSAGKLLVPEHCTLGTWDVRQGNFSLHRWNDQDRASEVWRQAVKTLSWHSFPILLGGNIFFSCCFLRLICRYAVVWNNLSRPWTNFD